MIWWIFILITASIAAYIIYHSSKRIFYIKGKEKELKQLLKEKEASFKKNLESGHWE